MRYLFNQMVDYKKYDLDLIFQALSDPSRRAMLRSISESEKSVTEVAKPFRRMSLAAASKHLKVLERAKLIHRRRDGNHLYLTVNGEAIRSADQWMKYYQRFWDSKLDSLQKLLEE